MTQIVPVVSVDDEILALARRYRSANSVGMQVLNLVGGQAENLLERLPDPAKNRLESAAEQALRVALTAAGRSRSLVPDQKGWFSTMLTTAMGAAGGAGGLPSSVAELPVTVTILMRAMLAIAVEHGFDPEDPEVMQGCLLIFASAGPLSEDDCADLGYLAARVSLTGIGVNALIAKLAPEAGRGSGAETGGANRTGPGGGGRRGGELRLYLLLPGHGACAVWPLAAECGQRRVTRCADRAAAPGNEGPAQPQIAKTRGVVTLP